MTHTPDSSVPPSDSHSHAIMVPTVLLVTRINCIVVKSALNISLLKLKNTIMVQNNIKRHGYVEYQLVALDPSSGVKFRQIFIS